MSVLSRLEAERHYIIRADEIATRLTRIESNLPLITDERVNKQDNIAKHVIVRSIIAGDFSGTNISESVIVDSQLTGNFNGADLTETDFIDTGFKGDFIGCPNSGSYYRRCDISGAKFNQRVPRSVAIDDLKIKRLTGIVIFCARVEESMFESDDFAVFMPVNFKLKELEIPFLARLYFDGIRKKLGLISTQDLLVGNSDFSEDRIWSGFIYTMPREQVEIRQLIIERMVQAHGQSSEFKIADPLEIRVQDQGLTLRPARPLDIVKIEHNLAGIHGQIRESIAPII